MKNELKKLLAFHNTQVDRFGGIDREQKAFHREAVMAFSKCEQLLEHHASESTDAADGRRG